MRASCRQLRVSWFRHSSGSLPLKLSQQLSRGLPGRMREAGFQGPRSILATPWRPSALVATNMFRNTFGHHGVSECLDRPENVYAAIDTMRQAFALKLVRQCRNLHASSVKRCRPDDDEAPEVITSFRPRPAARSVIQPQPLPDRPPLSGAISTVVHFRPLRQRGP